MTDGGRIIGFIESVTDRGIAGWALQPGGAGPLQLSLLIDGAASEVFFACDQPREDVWGSRADLHAVCGHGPLLGFNVAIPAGGFDGASHRFDLVTLAGASAGLVVIGKPRDWDKVFEFPRHVVVGRARPEPEMGCIHGWVYLLDRLTGAMRVGNTLAVAGPEGWRGHVAADGVRPDVAADRGCAPECGFNFDVAGLFPGGVRGEFRFSVLPEGLELPQGAVGMAWAGVAPVVVEVVEVVEALPEVVVSTDDPDNPDDPDDGRLAFSGMPRGALFGIGARLAGMRAGLAVRPAVGGARQYASDPEHTVSLEFDRDYYLQTYRDVRAGGMDPVLHYVRTGWHEGRRPAAWFDTAYYLEANPDIREAGVNPFWHYLVIGRREGRAALREGGYRREVIEGLAGEGAAGPASALTLVAGYLEGCVRAACAGRAGLVVAVGGAGVAERLDFAGLGYGYLHLAAGEGGLVRLALDGVALGMARLEVLAGVLGRVGVRERRMVVHSLVGFDVAGLAGLRAGGGDVFWLDDFSALCAGGRLLRNDVAFCGAPGAESDACRVCVHGERRAAHLADVRRLFGAGGFAVVAPSGAAGEVWREAGVFEGPVMVRAPAVVVETSRRESLVAAEAWGSVGYPVRVAFAGSAQAGDGWAMFRALVERVGRLGCYRFFHLLDPGVVPQDSGQIEPLRVAGEGAADEVVLARHLVDLVLILPGGPEMFSGAALAALAAGADIVTLAGSGHAADAVMESGRGIVAADEAALGDLFESLRAVEYVRWRVGEGASAGGVVSDGMYAAVLGASA